MCVTTCVLACVKFQSFLGYPPELRGLLRACFLTCTSYASATRGKKIDRGVGGLENRVLMEIFGPKGREVTGDWRRLRNEELHGLFFSKYCSGNQIEKNEMDEACSTYGERKGADRVVLVGIPEDKRPNGRPWRRWEDNFKMDLK